MAYFGLCAVHQKQDVGTACDIILPTIRLKFKPENVRNREVPVPSFLQLPSRCI